MYKIILIILLLVSPLSGQTVIDSLKNELESAADSVKIKLENQIATKYRGIPDSIIIYAERALEGAGLQSLRNEEALALTSLGFAYYNKGDYVKGLDYNQRSLKIYEELGDKDGISRCLIRIGVVHYYQKNYRDALKYYTDAKNISEEIGDQEGVASCLTNIGIIYDVQNEYAKAIDYYNQSLEITVKLGKKRSIAIALINIGYAYNENREYYKAIDFLNRGLNLAEELGNKKAVTVSLLNIADSYFYLNNYSKAIEFAQKSLKVAREFNSMDDIQVAYKRLSECYAAQNRFKNAYDMHVLYKAMSDSIFNENNARQLHEMEQKYQSDKKERENEFLRKEQEVKDAKIKRQNLITIVISAGLALVVVFSVILFRANIQKKKTNMLLREQKEEIQKKSIDLQLANEKLNTLNHDLSHALQQVKTLSGMLPICSYCRKIRDDDGYWEQMEEYLLHHSDTEFSHGICPECYEKVSKEMKKYRPGKSKS